VKAAGRSGPRRYETAVAGGTAIRSKSLPDDAAALRRCCRAFAHTVDQGGSEQVGAVGNWIGGGPAHQPFLIGNRKPGPLSTRIRHFGRRAL
jgi:hypothetical protein